MSKTQKRKMNKTTRKLLVIIGVLLMLVSLVNILKIVLEDKEAIDDQNSLINILTEVPSEEDSISHEEEKELTLTGRSYNELLDINSDFKGWLSFRSGLVNQPVVQSSNNNYYLNRSFFGKSSSIGTAFLDADHNLNGQNMTIYGHLVYRNDKLMFSPLHKLKDQGNYDTNRYFSFSTGTEIRNYEVAIVFYYDVEEDGYSIPYFNGTFDEVEFNQYISAAKGKQFYETGVNLAYGDRFITLQTCVKNEDNLRLIIIGKQIGTEPLQ